MTISKSIKVNATQKIEGSIYDTSSESYYEHIEGYVKGLALDPCPMSDPLVPLKRVRFTFQCVEEASIFGSYANLEYRVYNKGYTL